MEISDLIEFEALARCGNFMQASEEVFISQSALSKHIKRMEKEIGYPLFIRNSRNVRLSEFGELMLPYARQIISVYQECGKTLRRHEQELQQTLTIGSTALMVPYGITSAISSFRKDNPGTHIDIVEGDTPALLELMVQKKLNLSFCIISSVDADSSARSSISDERMRLLGQFEQIPYATDILSVVLPEDHRYAGAGTLALSQLDEEPFIFWSSDTYMYELMRSACSYYHFSPNSILSASRGQGIVDMVAQKTGIALMLRRQALRVNNDRVVIIPVEPAIEYHISLLHRKSAYLSDVEQTFAAYVRLTGIQGTKGEPS